MKITNVSCTQFAGLRERNISLSDGINVIYGKNESGKSTIVNLISRTLFQDAKLDKRSDKEFCENFFPSTKKGSTFVADFADGKIIFETSQGTYTLTKEWGIEPRCILSTPDGVIRDNATIINALKELLVYGEGVYSDMLFSSQKNTDFSLQTILDASKKTDAKQEIIDAISQVFAESDGVSMDAVEQAINAKIDEIAGKHWNVETNAPVKKSSRWSNGLGEILKAYYALEDAKAVLTEISRLEEEADRASAIFAERDVAVRSAENAYNKFNTFSGMLSVQNERKKTVARIEAELRKIEDVLHKWPDISEKLCIVKKLESEFKDRKNLDLYFAAKALNDSLSAYKEKISGMVCPTDNEIAIVKNAQRQIAILENKLCGINLIANVKMFDGNQVEIKSLRTGSIIDVSDAVSITESVIISIPGIMEMQLAPADVNVAEIEVRLHEYRQNLDDVFKKYGVSVLEELENIKNNYSSLQTDIAKCEVQLSALLESASFEEIQATVNNIIGTPRSKVEISADITSFCGNIEISRYIVSNETIIKTYENDYTSIAELKAKAFDLQIELKKAQSDLVTIEDIPLEFANITDPDRYLEGLQNDLKFKQQLREDALREKSATASRLESYKENRSGDPIADVENADCEFRKQKSLLAHWQHIAQVFSEQKENIADNPLVDLAENFARYLNIISGGKVISEFPEADKLNMSIYSSERLVDYAKLSEGTKETVSLAFRLAVLEHLFPDGGGVVVLDDPFANMDAERTAQSIALIKECGKRHQVILLTCKENYLDAFEGYEVRL